MALECGVCEHQHDEDGSCDCGCQAEQEVDQFCWNCGDADHDGRDCKCGCTG